MNTFIVFFILSTSAYAQSGYRVAPGKFLRCSDMGSLKTCETPGHDQCIDPPDAVFKYAENCRSVILKDCAKREKSFGCQSLKYSSEKAMKEAIAGISRGQDPALLKDIFSKISEAYKSGASVEFSTSTAGNLVDSLLSTMNEKKMEQILEKGFGDCSLTPAINKPGRKALIVQNSGVLAELGTFGESGTLKLSFQNLCNFKAAKGGNCSGASKHLVGVAGQNKLKEVSVQDTIKEAAAKFKVRGRNFKTIEDFEALDGAASMAEILSSGLCNKVYPTVAKNPAKDIKSPKVNNSDRNVRTKNAPVTKPVDSKTIKGSQH